MSILRERMDAQHAEDQRQAEEMERWFAAVADHILEEVAKDRGAFRALAEIGLAIATGELMRITGELVGYVGCDRRDLHLLTLLRRLNNGRHAVLWGMR